MKRILLMAVSCLMMFGTLSFAADYRSGIQWEEPPLVEPGQTPGAPPSDAIVLFDGTNLDAWTGGPWDLKDGILPLFPNRTILKQNSFSEAVRFTWSIAFPVLKGTMVFLRRATAAFF